MHGIDLLHITSTHLPESGLLLRAARNTKQNIKQDPIIQTYIKTYKFKDSFIKNQES